MENARLMGSHLEEADLREAHLEGAELFGAHFEGADLDEAHLEGADLRGASGLTSDQITGAITDVATQLPDYLLPKADEQRPAE